MKKKILSSILAFCLIIPALFAVSACGKGKEEPVTFEGWAKAWISFPGNYSIIGGVSENDADYGEYYFAEDGFKIYLPNVTQSTMQEGYAKVENGVYTRYTKTSDDEWMAEKMTEEAYVMQKTMTNETYLGFMDDYESFVMTKNGFKNKEEITSTVTGSPYTFHYFDIVIKVDEEGKVTSATWKQKMTIDGVSTNDYNMTLTVGSVSITYPTATLISNNDWNDILNFENYAPVTLTLTYPNGEVYYTKYDGNNLHTYWVSENLREELNTYYVNNGDTYYYYQVRNWMDGDYSEEVSFMYTDDNTYTAKQKFDLDINSWLDRSDKFFIDRFAYNSETKKYEQESLYYNDDGYEISNSEISFVNGKCTEIVYTQDGTDFVLTISYGSVEITVPTLE